MEKREEDRKAPLLIFERLMPLWPHSSLNSHLLCEGSSNCPVSYVPSHIKEDMFSTPKNAKAIGSFSLTEQTLTQKKKKSYLIRVFKI